MHKAFRNGFEKKAGGLGVFSLPGYALLGGGGAGVGAATGAISGALVPDKGEGRGESALRGAAKGAVVGGTLGLGSMGAAHLGINKVMDLAGGKAEKFKRAAREAAEEFGG